MNPFKNIFRLSVGDFLAKTLYFLAFIYLARVLGVSSYGVLEFALSILTYFLVLADGGLELWATREAARGQKAEQLAAQIMPLRLALTAVTFGVLLALLPFLPAYPYLRPVLLLFGLTLFAQAFNLKWVFMGRERMSHVAVGLLVAQVIFAVAVFALVRRPEHVVWVPALRLAGDLAMAVYFGRPFVTAHGWPVRGFTRREAGAILKPALVMGLSQGLAFMSYNFDSLLLGLLVGARAVGWYGAAYKPITALLAVPVTYYTGLFPTLSRTYQQSEAAFRHMVARSLRLTAMMALPVGIGGSFLAGPVIGLLFGPDYANSVLPLQILSWAAVMVILRGNFRHSLNAAGRQDLDLRCAGSAIAMNVGLNLIFIPRYGIVGAAATTLVTEIFWLGLAFYYFNRHVAPINPLPYLRQPFLAGVLMAAGFVLLPWLPWPGQAATATLIYFAALFLQGGNPVRFILQEEPLP
jgi:O-antigen/teichoic acid export membrane protein